MVDVKPSQLFIGSIIFVVCILFAISIINRFVSVNPSMLTKDGATYTQFQNAYNKSITINSKAEELEALLAKQDPSAWDILNIVYLRGFNVIGSTFSTFTFLTGMITDTSELFGFMIPKWFTALLITMITVILVFAIISAILQREL